MKVRITPCVYEYLDSGSEKIEIPDTSIELDINVDVEKLINDFDKYIYTFIEMAIYDKKYLDYIKKEFAHCKDSELKYIQIKYIELNNIAKINLEEKNDMASQDSAVKWQDGEIIIPCI